MPTPRVQPEPAARTLFKGMLRGSALYTAALFGQRLISIALLPINTRFLTPADYGVLDLIEQISVVVSLLLGSGFGAAMGYFYYEKDSPESRRSVVDTTLIGATGIGAITGLLGLLFSHPVSVAVFGSGNYQFYLQLSFYAMPASFLLEAAFTWLRVEDRAGLFALASLARMGLTALGVVLLLAVFRLGVLGMLLTSIGVIVICAVGLGAYAIRARPRFDWSLFVRMFLFSLPIGYSGIAMFVIHFGDRFILPHYRPFSELGLYSVAYKISMLISFIYASFHNYWSAQVYQIFKREDAKIVFGRTFTYVALVLTSAALALLLATRPLLKILTTAAFQSAAAVVPLLLAAYFIRSLGEFFRCIFVVEGRPSCDAICNWIGATVCVTGYFALIPPYGIWGAAIATAITFVVITAISVIWSYRIRPYQLETRRLLKMGIAGGTVVAAYVLVPVQSLPAQIGWAALLLAAFPALLWTLRFTTPGERQLAEAAAGRVAVRLRSALGR